MPNELREKIAKNLYMTFYEFASEYPWETLLNWQKEKWWERSDKIMECFAPELEKAEEVDKFISSCSLNPLHGCYRTCAQCFCRMSCAKIKSKALEKEPR